MKLWCLAVPNAMKDHDFTDDVAICRAFTQKGAVKKFKRLYAYDQIKMFMHTTEVKFNKYGIAILTDF